MILSDAARVKRGRDPNKWSVARSDGGCCNIVHTIYSCCCCCQVLQGFTYKLMCKHNKGVMESRLQVIPALQPCKDCLDGLFQLMTGDFDTHKQQHGTN